MIVVSTPPQYHRFIAVFDSCAMAGMCADGKTQLLIADRSPSAVQLAMDYGNNLLLEMLVHLPHTHANMTPPLLAAVLELEAGCLQSERRQFLEACIPVLLGRGADPIAEDELGRSALMVVMGG